ncbi:hypothetical protein LguiB_028010 [Lonicera macranthoides]
MAIVSSQEAASSSTFGYNYQVFLSFRGEDTRKTFTDHLYTALVQAGLRTFRDDDDIERGKRIELELGKAIQESRISIIVFSKNYASSKWCLDEVVMILEWSRSGSRGHEVLPIFYDVDPLDGTKTIEGLVLDMQMYKDDACNDRKGKKSLYDEFCGTYLSSNQGSSFRRCYFNFLSSEPSLDVDFNYDAFSRMDKLKLLKLNYAKLNGRWEMFPKGLRWLCWHGFPLKSIPYDFPLGNIVSVDMSYSKLEHAWTGNKVLASLKILNLSHSQRLIKTPNFKGLPNLERLILEGCVCLVEVSDTIENLERLDLLNLKNCKSLKKFPNIGMIKSLQTLVLDACSNIREFPMDLMNMESLKVLNANGVRVTINPLISTRRDHVKLCHTFFQSWVSKPILKNPEDIHVSFPCSLVKLSLRNCDLSDNDFPLDFSNLSRLEMLDLSHNNFLTLPQCIGSLRKLSNLYLTSCKELHSISGLPKVTFLEVSKCSSLESVADQSPLTRLIISPSSCGKLREIKGMFKLEPMEKVNREILDNLGLYGVELIGNLSTFLRREEIPSWCGVRNDNKGSSSSSSSSGPFVVPSNPTSLRIRGLNVYSVYTFSNVAEIYDCSMLFTIINNKSKDLKWIYNPVAIAIPEKGKEEEEFVWLSHWKLGNHLESGDEVDVSVISISDGLEVKEFGINFVWGEEEEEEMKASHHRNNTREVISGELSNYQFIRPGAFLLCNHYYSYIYSWGSKSRFQELFGDHTTLEGKPNLSSKNVETERKVDDRISLMHSDSCCFRPTSYGRLVTRYPMGGLGYGSQTVHSRQLYLVDISRPMGGLGYGSHITIVPVEGT